MSFPGRVHDAPNIINMTYYSSRTLLINVIPSTQLIVFPGNQPFSPGTTNITPLQIQAINHFLQAIHIQFISSTNSYLSKQWIIFHEHLNTITYNPIQVVNHSLQSPLISPPLNPGRQPFSPGTPNITPSKSRQSTILSRHLPSRCRRLLFAFERWTFGSWNVVFLRRLEVVLNQCHI